MSVASFHRTGGLVVFWEPRGGFRGWSTLRKVLGSKEHLDWFKIDFNATEIITVQDYNKKVIVNGSTHILKLKLKLRVKQVIYESNIKWQNKNAKVARYSARDHKNLCILPENSAEDLGSKRECCWDWCWGYMVKLQSLNYIEGNNWTSSPIWNYATGTLTSWKGS